jgi:hypothetical protein
MNVKVELKNGYFKSNLCLKDRLIDTAYKEFISKDFTYKKTYLQKKYNYGFDGYSYLGQKDSSNQYAEDLLHSFVISEFSDPKTFPKEFDACRNINFYCNSCGIYAKDGRTKSFD